MRRLLALAAVLATTQLAGCFFIFIPGGLVSRISDGLTGDEGAHCVGAYVKVGDRIRLPGNGSGTVKSLSGKSMRCTDDALPVRALIVPD